MPKGKGFVAFALKRKSELENNGTSIKGGLKEVIPMVASEWTALTKEERNKFETKAKGKGGDCGPWKKSEGAKSTLPDGPKSFMSDPKEQLQCITGLLNFVDPTKMGYILIHCNFHSRLGDSQFIPSEIALSVFSLERGLIDSYWTLVDPVRLPSGCILEARSNSEKFGVPLPPFEPRFADVKKIWRNITQFITRYSWNEEHGSFIFSLPSEMRAVLGCLEWLFQSVHSQEPPLRFKLLPLNQLTFELFKSPPVTLNQIYLPKMPKAKFVTPRPSTIPAVPLHDAQQCTYILQSWHRAFYPEIACPHHQTKSALTVDHCALGTVNRNAMTIMELLSPVFRISLKPGIHLPFNERAKDTEKRNGFLLNWGYTSDFLQRYSIAEGIEVMTLDLDDNEDGS